MDIIVGQEYYFIHFDNNKKLPGGQFNLNNYEIVKGRVREANDTIKMETVEFGLLDLKNPSLFKEYADAEKYRLHLTF